MSTPPPPPPPGPAEAAAHEPAPPPNHRRTAAEHARTSVGLLLMLKEVPHNRPDMKAQLTAEAQVFATLAGVAAQLHAAEEIAAAIREGNPI